MKKLLLIMVVVCSTITLYSQTVYDSLLFFYSFDGNTVDCSPHGFDAIDYRVTLTEDRFGNPESAYYFDGTTAYIEFPFDSLLKPMLPVSFSAWVSFEEGTNTSSQFFTNDYTTDAYTGVWAAIGVSNTIGVSYGDGYGIGPYYRRTKVADKTIIQPGQWYHIVCVINGPVDMDIYINGINDGGYYTGTSNSLMEYSSGPGCLGRKYANYGIPPLRFKGSMDEVGYWNRALTQADVDTLYSHDLCITTVMVENPYSIDIYPNPSNDHVNIDVVNYNDLNSLYVEVTNAIGQQVYKEKVASAKTILTKDQFKGSGLFFVKISDPDIGFAKTSKIIIN